MNFYKYPIACERKGALARLLIACERKGALARLVIAPAILVFLLSCVPAIGANETAATAGMTEDNRVINSDNHDAFIVGYCLQDANRLSLTYLHSIKRLDADVDDNQGKRLLKDLVQEGLDTRIEQSKLYDQTAIILGKLRGPEKAIDWLKKTSKKLSMPVPVTDEYLERADKQPEMARIYKMIDDITEIRGKVPDIIAMISPSLRMKNGKSALWSSQVGAFASTLQDKIGTNDVTIANTADELLRMKPDGEPESIVRIITKLETPPVRIGSLSASNGNLSGIIASNRYKPVAEARTESRVQLIKIYHAADILGPMN